MPAVNGYLSKYWNRYRHWRRVTVAGVLGFAVTLAAMQIIDAYSVRLTALSIALAAVAGSLVGVCVVGSLSAWRIRRRLAGQNMQLDAALNNMIQGLCMFDAQNRLLVWNERYRAMYNINPKRIWRGCSIRDLLEARIAAGTFPLDPTSYDNELRGELERGNTFVVNVELADGASSTSSTSRSRAAAGSRRMKTSRSAKRPSANSSKPALSSTPSSRTCRRRSS
jgi:PAS domain-containing protein